MQNKNKLEYDVVVCGGGLAGICAAISAARLGCSVAFVHDRPVLGGNASSEIRLPAGGAGDCNPWAKETGIIEEILLEDRIKNHTPYSHVQINSLWDLTLYDKVKRESNITLFLNTSVRKALMDGHRIKGALCSQMGTEKELGISGDLFVDATGDGVLAFSAGAEFRTGREGRKEFNESLAPQRPDKGIMGSSLMFQAKDIGYPVSFTLPSWAVKYKDCKELGLRDKDLKGKVEGGFWWIEIGVPYDTIIDNEKIRDELLRHLLGIWDHIKNHPKHREANKNMALEWVGTVPGKRESRRFIGDYILTQNDIKQNVLFPDRVAYGGWFLDCHIPGGLLVKRLAWWIGGETSRAESFIFPYSVPLRCLYSQNVKNLFLAGRDISVSHVALGTTRLMATCAVIGQAVGTTAYFCKKHNILPSQIYPKHIKEVQQQLLKDDCFVMGVSSEDKNDLANRAKVTASSTSPLIFPEGEGVCPLDIPRGQIFPVSSDCIEEVSLLLKSDLSEEIDIKLGLRKADNIWDLRSEEDIIVSTALIPPGQASWVTFKLNQKITPKTFYWIYLEPKEGISWCHGKERSVGVATLEKKFNWYWSNIPSFTMKLTPDSFPYQPENITSGVSRPYDWTNLWISDPEKKFPQWLELDLRKKTVFNTICLTFDSGLHGGFCFKPAFFKPPECVRDYDISYMKDGKWKKLVKVKDNYQRHVIHHIKPITFSKLKFEFLAANGSASVGLYEVRVYNEA